MKSAAELMQEVFLSLNEKERREIYIMALMIARNTTYRAIATRHRLSEWFVSACARGRYKMSERMRKAFERDLWCDLTPFLLEGEEALDKYKDL